MKRATYLLAAVALAAGMATAANAKTLIYCSEASPEGFDAGAYTSGPTFDASSQAVYNRLLEFERGTVNVGPGLAESWKTSADGKEVTFHLRKGVKFGTTDYFKPTRALNADDVVFTFARMLDKSNPYYDYADWTYFNGNGMDKSVTAIDKVDDYTVKFTLTGPDALFVFNLATDFASIVSKEYADKLLAAGTREVLNQKPVGTGPFVFVDYQTDASIRYKSNPDYWRGKTPIDDLVFAITPDAAVRLQKIKAGECHVATQPAVADIAAAKADSSIVVLEQAGQNVGFLAYNTQQKPFDDARVRKALNMAINKKAIIEAIYLGTGVVAKNPIPPTLWSYNDAIVDDSYDPAAAKKLLGEAGVPEGFEMSVWAMPVARPYNPSAKRMAEMIQNDFAEVGVTVRIVSYAWGEYLKRTQAVDRDGAVLIGWTADLADPDNFLGVLLGCESVGSNNRAQWCDKNFNDLIVKAKVITDQGERSKLYEQAQVIFKDQAPWATIAHALNFTLISPKVKNYVMDPVYHYNFEGVDIEE